MADLPPLRIFVAMPGTSMGPNATYKDPESVKANLLVPVVDSLKMKLGRDVVLVIEKDKRTAGVIHESMFAEARDADVYIADLTGANPNVYLELGVRWALRDNVTVIICQDVQDLRFNVFANRAILYYPDIIIKAIADLVDAIDKGLRESKVDSPVRLNGQYVTVPRSNLDELSARIKQLTEERGEDLLRAAGSATNNAEKLAMLKQAVNANPASPIALLELGKAHRSLSQYAEAIAAFEKAIRLAPNQADLHRELGVTYSKSQNPQPAAASLREAVRLAPNDAEAWSNLGGALRRVGMSGAPKAYDKSALADARSCYATAHSLSPFDLYSGLNVARLDLILSKWEPERAQAAKDGFQSQIYLCRHMVQQNPADYWRLFDLADALLFSGDYPGAYAAYDQAVLLIPGDERADVIRSVLGPLEGYVAAGVLDGQLLEGVTVVTGKLQALA